MKICYIANIRLPTEKAHGIQIMKTCEALALEGHEVTLIVPRRKDSHADTIFAFYSLEKKFPIIFVSSVNLLFLGKIGFIIQTLFFSEMAAWKIFRLKADAVYSRDELVLFNYFFVFPNLFFEAHRGDDNIALRLLLKKAKLVTISRGLLDFYAKYLKNPSEAVVVPDAVDVGQFQISLSKEECREKLSLPKDKKIALYAGHLYDWKGAHVLADAAENFSADEIAVFVGGTPGDIESFKIRNTNNNNMLILGQKPHHEIPCYLRAADVLVLPNSAKEAISRLYTSPMKLFEYMASGTPIVASSLPSLKEIIDENTSVLVEPDDAMSLYKGIKSIFDDSAKGQKLADTAQAKVAGMTWQNRAKAIASFIASNI